MCKRLLERLERPRLPRNTQRFKHFGRFHGLAKVRSAACHWLPAKGGRVAQRIVEMLIGRLITDEEFREEFLQHPEATLLGLSDRGIELSRAEIGAVLNTDRTLWARTGDAIDPRLHKASLKTESR